MPALALVMTPLEDALLTRMDPSEVADRIYAMRRQEEITYGCADYLGDNEDLRATARKPVDEECRVKMCEWCYQVVDFCKFRRETVAIGMSYLDRYLSTSAGRGALTDRKEYQLSAMTTLYMAIKLHEPLEMETSLLADLSRGCYNEQEISDMEKDILNALGWRIQGPTPLAFVQHFLALLPETVIPAVATAVMDYARFQTELAVSDYTFVTERYSHIALAAILNAVEGVDLSLFPLKSQGSFLRAIERHSEILVEEVEETQVLLNDVLLDVYAEDSEPPSPVQSASTGASADTGTAVVAGGALQRGTNDGYYANSIDQDNHGVKDDYDDQHNLRRTQQRTQRSRAYQTRQPYHPPAASAGPQRHQQQYRHQQQQYNPNNQQQQSQSQQQQQQSQVPAENRITRKPSGRFQRQTSPVSVTSKRDGPPFRREQSFRGVAQQ